MSVTHILWNCVNLFIPSVVHQLDPGAEGVQPLLHRPVPQQRVHLHQLDIQQRVMMMMMRMMMMMMMMVLVI